VTQVATLSPNDLKHFEKVATKRLMPENNGKKL